MKTGKGGEEGRELKQRIHYIARDVINFICVAPTGSSAGRDSHDANRGRATNPAARNII